MLGTLKKYVCVSRPRRFGKSIAANMLAAYYGRECDSSELFSDLEISKADSFEKYRNQYDVLFLNMQSFLCRAENPAQMVEYLQEEVLNELKEKFAENIEIHEKSLPRALERFAGKTGRSFIFIIDEWDCIFREKKSDKDAQTKYLDFLRDLYTGTETIQRLCIIGGNQL